MFDWFMDILTDIRKLQDVIKTLCQFLTAQAHQRGFHAYVVHATEIGLESGAQFKHCSNIGMYHNPAMCWLNDTCQHF